MHRRTALTLALASAASLCLALDAFDFSSPRQLAMGGSHIALADDWSVLLENPAGLAAAPGEVRVADLGLRAMGPVFDIVNMATGGSFDLPSFLAANGYKLFAGVELSGPLALGYVGQGLGFGLFNKTGISVNASDASNIGIFATEDILLSGGYAFRFDLGGGHALDLGLGAKGFVRGSVGDSLGIIDAAALFEDPAAIVGMPFDLATGIGFDLGLRWSWRSLAAGLVCRDLYSPAIVTRYSDVAGFFTGPSASRLGDPTYDTLDRSLDFGFAWTPDLGVLERFLDSVTVAVDYRDILDLFALFPRNAILNVGLGVEARMLDIVAIRAGINEALLSVGAGIDLGACKMGVSVLGSERGDDPGQLPTYNLVLDFDFRF